MRAINFGTLNPTQEPFVLSSAGADPSDPLESVDCVIEDCIVEQPAIDNFGGSTCINMGSFERGSDGIVGYHRACVDRDCVIDCEYKLNPVAITQINLSGGVATVTTLGTMMETVLLATSGELQTRAVNNAILAFICYSPNN